MFEVITIIVLLAFGYELYSLDKALTRLMPQLVDSVNSLTIRLNKLEKTNAT